MPTYDYACTACNHEFEAFHSMKDPPIAVCPKCRKRKVKRRVGGGAGLIFKGSGFYITDYKNQPAKAGGEGGSKSESTPAKADTKSDSKSGSAAA